MTTRRQNRFFNRRLMRGTVLMFILALALVCGLKFAHAEASMGTNQASASFKIQVTVPPVVRLIEEKPTPEGLQVTLWTNMPSLDYNGQTLRFDRVGIQTFTIPTPTQNYGSVEVDTLGRVTISTP